MKKIRKVLVLATVFVMATSVFTGCGKNTKNDSADTTGDDNVIDDAADVVDDVGEGIGDAAEDAGNALSGNSFDNYNDAHDYFLEQMGGYNQDAKYEVRNESQDLMEYQSGSKGYRFELYDTSKDEKGTRVGEYYVDSSTGLIYSRDEESGEISQYGGDGSDGGDSGTEGSTGAGGTGAGGSGDGGAGGAEGGSGTGGTGAGN